MELETTTTTTTQPPACTKVPKATIEAAVNALFNHKSEKSINDKPQLLPSDEFLHLVLTLTKIPAKSRVNAFKLPLPHPLHNSDNSELCLFVSDDNSKIAKDKIKEDNLPVAKVLKLTKLKKQYKAFEQKRKLCDSYDMFLAEKKIVPLLPNAIGKWFYKKKKVPVPVELSRGNWKEQIERVCSSAMLYLSTGSCCVIKVARVSMDKSEIVENVVAAIEGVASAVPKKWANIRSFHLKFSESLALPIYQKVPEIGFKIGGEEKKVIVEVEKSGKAKAKKEDVAAKKMKKKGRIHEVRYMDDVMVGEDEVGNESEGEEVVDKEEEVVGKKRKKVDVEKKVKKADKPLKKKKDLDEKNKPKKSKVSV